MLEIDMYDLKEGFDILSEKYQINEIGIGSKIKKIAGKASGINIKSDKTVSRELGFKRLHTACMKSDYDEVKNIIEWGGDPNIIDNNGNTALHITCGLKNAESQDNIKIFSLLLDNGADINIKNNKNITPLLLICKTINLKFMEILIKNKIIDLDSAYEAFKKFKSTEILELILKSGLDINRHYNSIIEYIRNASNARDYSSPYTTITSLPVIELACEIIDLLEEYGFEAKTSKDQELIDFLKVRTRKEKNLRVKEMEDRRKAMGDPRMSALFR